MSVTFKDVKPGDQLTHPEHGHVVVVSKASRFLELRPVDAEDHPQHSSHHYPSDFDEKRFEKFEAPKPEAAV